MLSLFGPLVPEGYRITLIANVHCRVTGLIPGLWFLVHHHTYSHHNFSGIPCAHPPHGDPEAIVSQDQTVHGIQQVQDGANAEMSQSKDWLWVWVAAELVSVRHWGHFPQARGFLNSWSVFPCLWWGIEPCLPSAGSHSPMRAVAMYFSLIYEYWSAYINALQISSIVPYLQHFMF